MQRFQDWLENFISDKREVPSPSSSNQFAIHSMRRFVGATDSVWEIAFTYTDRLVVRQGTIKADGVSVNWKPWATEHSVEI